MRKSWFTETQIIGMIKELEAALTVADVCRKHGINSEMFLQMQGQVRGIEVSETRTVI